MYDSTKYLALKNLGRADWIRTHLFPGYKTTPAAPPRNRKTQAGLTAVKNQLPAAAETIKPADLLQRANNVDTAVKRLASDASTNTDNEEALPLRELLGLE